MKPVYNALVSRFNPYLEHRAPGTSQPKTEIKIGQMGRDPGKPVPRGSERLFYDPFHDARGQSIIRQMNENRFVLIHQGGKIG
jgi:hypothetical protein